MSDYKNTKTNTEHQIILPLTKEKTTVLKCGDAVLLTGIIYAARDAAHKRMLSLLVSGKDFPFELNNAIIYYVGPTPSKPGKIIGSAGPTTATRMDIFTPRLLDEGLIGMIGKGKRSADVIEAIKRNKAVYFGAPGGLGVLLADRIIKKEIVAFEDLGAEAIFRLEVKDFPVTVVIDTEGNDLYELGVKNYLSEKGN